MAQAARQVRGLTAEEMLLGVKPTAEQLLLASAPEPATDPAEAGFLDSIGAIPETIGRTLGAFGRGAPMDVLAERQADVERAKGGDQAAAGRLGATGLLAGAAAGALIPGGPAIQAGRMLLPTLAARAGLGALGGAISGGVEAGARGGAIAPGAASGALFGAGGGLAASAAAKAVQRLLKAKQPIPAKLADQVRAETTRAAKAATGAVDLDPVSRVTEALKQVPDLRPQQEALTRVGRARQIKSFEKAGEGLSGEARASAKLRAMAGPLEKVEFGSLRPLLDQGDIDQLFSLAETSPMIAGFERPRAIGILKQLLRPEGVTIPAPAELKLLERLFGSEMVQTLVEKRGTLSKFEKIGLPLLNTPRELMASVDFSAPLRQGLLIGAGHPKAFARNFRDMFKYAVSEPTLLKKEAEIVQRPTYEYMNRAGLALTKPGSVVGEQEERFGGSLARKVPGLRQLIEGSERAYTGFLNGIRADVFDSMIADAQKAGLPLDDDALRGIAGFVNAASGRGNLPKWAQAHAHTANVLFFSPRLMAGRFQTLDPRLYIKSDPVTRQHAIRSALSLGAMTTTALSLAAMAGAEVDSDPTSSDWAKIKIGNVRYDILGGFQQYGTLGARLLQAVVEEQGTERFKTMGTAGGNFFRNKFAPIPSLVMDIFAPRHGDVVIEEEVAKRFSPMVLQDTWAAMREMGWIGLPMSAPAIFGVGVSAYE